MGFVGCFKICLQISSQQIWQYFRKSWLLPRLFAQISCSFGVSFQGSGITPYLQGRIFLPATLLSCAEVDRWAVAARQIVVTWCKKFIKNPPQNTSNVILFRHQDPEWGNWYLENTIFFLILNISSTKTLWMFPKIGVPQNGVYNGKPYKNGWFGITTIFGDTPILPCHGLLLWGVRPVVEVSALTPSQSAWGLGSRDDHGESFVCRDRPRVLQLFGKKRVQIDI